MSLDKFFGKDKEKSDKEKDKKAEIRDVLGEDPSQHVTPDKKPVVSESTLSDEATPEPDEKEHETRANSVDEPVVTIPGFEHKWEPDWLENVSKEELYYMLKETVEANRKFHHLKSYIEKQMVREGPLDSREMSIRLNLTEGEILILFDSIHAIRKSKGGR